MTSRSFTPQRARHTAERLRPTLERIRRVVGTLERQRPARCGPEQLVERGYFTLVARLHRLLAEVRSSGAALVDIRHGGVRFPATRAGRPVQLCWRPDRPTLSWTDPTRAVGEPQPVDDDDPWGGE